MPDVLADTGFFVALFNKTDAYNERVVQFLKSEPSVLRTTWPVITDACFFLDAAWKTAFLAFIQRGGVTVHDIPPAELPTLITVFRKYPDREVDLADASLIWLAEKTRVARVLTIDRQDFQIYQLSKNRRFVLVL